MRMTASWLRSSRINRIQGCGAISRPMGELPSNCRRAAARAGKPDRPTEPAAVLVTVKGKSLRDGLRPPLTVTARGGQSNPRSGRGDGPNRVEQGDESIEDLDLTAIAPYKVSRTPR